MAKREPDSTIDVPPVNADFAVFYTREFASIALIAGTTAGDRSSGEDIAQEAFNRAHRDWDRIAGFDKPGAWVRRVAINLALTRRRSIGREARAVLRLGGRLRPTVDDHRHGDPAVWEAVGQLPPQQRAAIALHYFEDRPVAEIADLLGCTRSTATSHLHKARTRLADLLGGAR